MTEMSGLRPEPRAGNEDKTPASRGGTRTVRMIEGISGPRHDGRPWPAAGATIEISGTEAQELVDGRMAVYEGDEPKVHSGETVPASVPPGHVATGRAARGEASTEEIMTGHSADPSAEERAAAEQHGGRLDPAIGADAGRHLHPDPRPDSQILAEDYAPAEREKIELGKKDLDTAKDRPAGERRRDREEGIRDEARRRAAERDSALRYARDGVTGAPGAEVPHLADGDEPAYPGEGVRPPSQVEAEYQARGEHGEHIEDEDRLSEEERIERETREPGYTRETVTEPLAGQPALPPETAVTNTPASDGAKVTAEDEADVRESTRKAGKDAGDAGDGKNGNGKDENSAPAPSSPKQDWIDYAVREHGLDVHAAGAMTKADLMSRYGGRL